MRKICLTLAFAAALSTVALPVINAQAAPREGLIQQHTRSGNLAVLTKQQMIEIGRTNPDLHARLVEASKAGTIPQLSWSERRLLRQLSLATVASIKAGQTVQVQTTPSATAAPKAIADNPVANFFDALGKLFTGAGAEGSSGIGVMTGALGAAIQFFPAAAPVLIPIYLIVLGIAVVVQFFQFLAKQSEARRS